MIRYKFYNLFFFVLLNISIAHASPSSNCLTDGYWLIISSIIFILLTSFIILLITKIRKLQKQLSEEKEFNQKIAKSEDKFRTIVIDAVEGIFQSSVNGIFKFANQTMAKILGHDTPDELITNVTDIGKQIYIDSAQRNELFARIQKHGKVFGFETQWYKKDNTVIWISLNARAINNAAGEIEYIEGFVKDISQSKRSEISLKKQKEHLEELARDRAVELIKTNKKLTNTISKLELQQMEILKINKLGILLQACSSIKETYNVVINTCRQFFPSYSGYLSIFDSSQQTLVIVASWGKNLRVGMAFEHNQCWSIRLNSMYIVQDPEVESLCSHPNVYQNYSCICAPMITQGEILGMLHLCMGEKIKTQAEKENAIDSAKFLLESILERFIPCLTNIRLRESLKIQSIKDPLTGLYNRRYMEETLNREMHRIQRKNTCLGIIMIDVDHFKQFNDNYGHEVGDSVLRDLGAFLQHITRKGDIACRYGGEEFTIIMPESNLDTTYKRAEELRRGAKEDLKIIHHGKVYRITISVGVAINPDHGITAEDILKAADNALYQAKQEGRNRVVTASPI
ncbi:MAG: GGDEF domain-containing protein [Desulfobacterales bacterium]|nr:GGDEF domain-containing protein [Desulfobacterales bacterium]